MRPRFPGNNRNKILHQINHFVPEGQLRVIDEMGEMVGLMSKQQALNEAGNQEKDLVLVAAQTVPPVVKIIDYNKFLYQENKKVQASKSSSHKGDTKDVQLSFLISPHDLERVRNKAKSFIAEGHQVRVRMRLHGRQLGKKDFATNIMNEFLNSLSEVAIATEAKFQGNTIISILTKKKHAQ